MLFTRPFGLVALAAATLHAQAASICNGHAELCSKPYSNVTFLGTHNSYAVGSSIADNQNKYAPDQLNDGIRTLQMQAHSAADGIHLCHSSCSLKDGGSLTNYLSNVTTWVKANPTEVITLVIVNSDNLPPSQFASSFDASGLSSYVYSPSAASLSISAWPTLGSLVDSGKTVIVFMDYDADFSSVPYIIDEFSNMWEDAYDVTSTGWGCAVNRSSGNSGSMMMMVNHFLDTTYNLGGTQFWIPDTAAINTTNSESSLSTHVGNCNSIWGRNPNHILVDFYDSNGNVPFDYVAQLNGVSAPTNTVTQVQAAATGSVTSSGAVTGSSGTTRSSGRAGSLRMTGGSTKWAVGIGAGVLGVVVGGMTLGL